MSIKTYEKDIEKEMINEEIEMKIKIAKLKLIQTLLNMLDNL